MKLGPEPVRGQQAYRLPIGQRRERVASLVRALGDLEGGAKLALHYTDVAPAVVVAAVTRNGNHPFVRLFAANRRHETELNVDALSEILRVYRADFLSPVHIGWAKGFLDEQRERLPQDALLRPAVHPREAVAALATALADAQNDAWYE
jgi:CRISPR-associated protein Cst2